jgi:branched-chain amino acid transport system permease protein
MFWQQVVNSISLGAVYAIFAVGYTLVFGVLQILNLAHASVYMVGAFFALYLVTVLGLSVVIALAMSMVFCGFLGLALYFLVFKPIRKRDVPHQEAELLMLIASIAASHVVISLMRLIVGVDVMRFPPQPFAERMLSYGPVQVSALQLLILISALLLMLVLQLVVSRTPQGRSIRAVAESDRTSGLLGVNVEKVILLTMFLSSALGAAAGVLISLQTSSLWVHMGDSVELKALSIIILGGLGSISGAFVAAILIGFIDVFSTAYISSLWKDAIIFGILFGTLILKPSGLFGFLQKRRV